MKTMFDIIKKQNGEHFAKAIRAYDNGIFDIPDLDKIVKFAGREVEPLMNYLVSLKNVKIEEHAVHQHPLELLSKAGYTAYYADTLEKQNWPKQFYAKGEELCTFHDPNRYKNYHIVVAIKKNVQDIKRENFPHPKREDEYGTSVLQIQMLKSGGFISIKNRYNHTVENPDNTFNSNPDNIISGLSDALKHHYHVDFSSQKVHLPENFVLIDSQIVNCNYEINNVYFSENCYVEDGNIHEIDKQKELMLDYFILNLQDKSIKNPSELENGFIAALQEEIKDKKLQITVNEQGNKCLQADGKTILELDHGKIKSLHFDNVKKIDDNFLQYNNELSDVSLLQATNIGDNFLYWNKNLSEISLEQVTEIGNSFLHSNEIISKVYLPQVTNIGDDFLCYNGELSVISLPKVTKIGDDFLCCNNIIAQISLPKVTDIGENFLYENKNLTQISLPEVTSIGDNFLYENNKLQRIYLPKIQSIEYDFLENHPNKDKLWKNKDKPFTKDNNNFKIMQDLKSNHRE